MTGRVFQLVKSVPRLVLSISAVLAVAPAFAADTPAKPVTFSKDVAPIFQAKCQECHQPGSIAPMSLITFQDVRPWARSIKERVATRQMPPWHIDRSIGVQKFKNDMSLSDDQVDTIVRWVDAGAPQGDPKDLPAPKPVTTDNGWKGERDGYGPPDLVVKSSEYPMPAVHQDVWYRPMADLPITEPRWAKMVEIRPLSLKARKTIHHSIAYLVLNNDPEAVNTGTANGPDRRGPDADDIVNRRPQLKENALIENFQPHFHLRGKSMQVEAILPDGSKQVISYVGNFNFNWMTNYIYDDDAAPLLPKGTVIHVSAWYDNTKANKNNPDSDQWVGYGDRTVDEMAHAWMNVTYFTDAEYQELQAGRKAKMAKTTNDNEKQQ